MYVALSSSANSPTLKDVQNSRSLFVVVDDALSTVDAAENLGEVGTFGEEYSWLRITVLRVMGFPDDLEWRSQFDEMVLYAVGRGWISADSTSVRAHVVKRSSLQQ